MPSVTIINKTNVVVDWCSKDPQRIKAAGAEIPFIIGDFGVLQGVLGDMKEGLAYHPSYVRLLRNHMRSILNLKIDSSACDYQKAVWTLLL